MFYRYKSNYQEGGIKFSPKKAFFPPPYYKSVPKRTYKYTGIEYMARKAIKDRVTVLVGAAMDGFKLKPVVIGKYAEPIPHIGNCFILY